MARRRLKLTPFARFFIVMLFVAPIAYLVASYYNGEDGVQNIKDMLGIDRKETKEAPTPAPQSPAEAEDTIAVDCAELQKQIEQLQEDNLRLMEKVEAQEKKIEELEVKLTEQPVPAEQ